MNAASDLAVALDPAKIMETVGMDPDPWQAELLRSNAPRLLMLATRQAGKSTTTALLALHRILYQPGSLVLMMSPSDRQSGEIFKKLVDFYEEMGAPVPASGVSLRRIELENGSRCISLPGSEKTVRGFSGVDLLIIDEAARVSDDLYYSVRPMLAVSGGRLVLLSTPFGKRGFFFDEWENTTEGWHKFKVTAYDCPRISPEFLDEERTALGEWWFNQEYLCQFSESVGSIFSHEAIMAAMSEEIEPLFPEGMFSIS